MYIYAHRPLVIAIVVCSSVSSSLMLASGCDEDSSSSGDDQADASSHDSSAGNDAKKGGAPADAGGVAISDAAFSQWWYSACGSPGQECPADACEPISAVVYSPDGCDASPTIMIGCIPKGTVTEGWSCTRNGEELVASEYPPSSRAGLASCPDSGDFMGSGDPVIVCRSDAGDAADAQADGTP
jgi:hypothetical protein